MGLLDRFESGTERVFTAPFARLFRREELQPVELGSAIRKVMDSRAAIISRNRTIVPNVFTIELADEDFDRMISYDETITDELIADAQEYVTQQRYTPGGPLQIELVADPELSPGTYTLHHATVRNPATLDERGDIDTWDAAHERYDDAIDRHTSGIRIPSDARYLGEVDGSLAPDPAGGKPRNSPSRTDHTSHSPSTLEPAAQEEVQPTPDPVGQAGAGEDSQAAEQPSSTLGKLGLGKRERTLEPAVDQSQDTAAEQPTVAPNAAPKAPSGGDRRNIPTGTTSDATVATRQAPPRRQNAIERPWLEVAGERHPLPTAFTTLGRDPICDITIANDSGVSRRHTEVRVDVTGQNVQVSLRDLGSTNGTWVQGERVRNARMSDGDEFVVGQTTVGVHLGRSR